MIGNQERLIMNQENRNEMKTANMDGRLAVLIRWCLRSALLLALAGSATGAEQIITGAQAQRMVVDPFGSIFLKADCGSSDVASGTRTRIGSLNLNGPVPLTPNTIYSRTTCAAADQIPGNFAAAGSSVFFINGQGRLYQASGNSFSSSLALLYTTPDPARITTAGRIAVSSTRIFWTDEEGFEFADGGRLWVAPRRGGGTPELVVSHVESPRANFKKLHALADGRVIALLSDGRLVVVYFLFGFPPNPGSWNETTIASGVTALAVGTDRLWWVERNAAGTSATIITAPLANISTRTTLGTESLAISEGIGEMAVSDDKVFYQKGTSLAGGPIKRRTALVAGPAVELEAPPFLVLDMGATSRFVCWRRHNTAPALSDDIFRLPVGAAAVSRNLAAVGTPEVIQAIQNAANAAPLVANKVTLVRAFGRIVTSSAGETVLNAGPNMVLHGTRGGLVLPGSPLLPVFLPVPPPPLLTSAGDRMNQGDGYWFRLPDNWAKEGTVTLTAEVNPSHTLSETTFADNRSSAIVTFTPKVPIGLKIIPTLTHFGAITVYSPALEALFDQLEAIIPTSDLRVEVTRDFLDEDHHDFTHSPFEFRPDDDDKEKVLEGLRWKKVFGSGGTLAEPGGFDHYISLLPQTAQQHNYSGYAPVGWDLPTGTQVQPNFLFFLNPTRNPIGLREDVATAAQELAHNYGRRHVNCGSPDNVDSSYPYPTGTISSLAAGFLGFNVSANRLIHGGEATDYMSYCNTNWTSDYTWTALFNRISTGYGPALAAASASSPGLASLTGGIINLQDRTAEMKYVFQLGAAETARTTSSPYPVNAQYELRAYKNGGDLLGIIPVRTAIPSGDENHGPVTRLIWMSVIEGDLSVAVKLELVEKQNPAVPLGVLKGGNAAPAINIIAPTAGPVVGPELKIRWASTDDGGQPLSHIVRYSHDNGASWRTLIMHTASDVFFAPTESLPGGGKCLIEVIASDGILSTAARSPNFSLANKAPDAWLFFENGRGKICQTLATATVDCGERLVLHARTWDLEDGAVPDASVSWSVVGPVTRTGTGHHFQPTGLIPGTYTVTLTARDSSAATGSATATLIVRPAFVETATPAVTLDGFADDPAYAADRIPKDLRYSTAISSAQVRLVHRAGQLYVAASGLLPGAHAEHRFAIGLDLNHSGGAPETNDLQINVYDEGTLTVQRGNGLVWAPVADPVGVEASVSSDGVRWAAEISIPDSWLAGWDGRTVRCLLADLDRTAIGDNAVWPPDGNLYNLTTWCDLVLGADPDDPTDADRDGMPDAWEVQTFGNSKGDELRDSDGDGQSDSAEFIGGSNPNLASSFLRASVVVKGATRTLSWQSAPGRSYTVWRSEDLLEFTPIATGLLAAIGTVTTWNDPAPLAGHAFYRVEAHYCR